MLYWDKSGKGGANMEFHELYRPLTAAPFRSSAYYREVLPIPALRPWIRCFWESSGGDACSTLVTPDSCMDILFDLAGEKAGFCGIDDRMVWAAGGGGYCFAIRFYPWTAGIFAEDTLKSTRNARCEATQYFGKLEAFLRSRLETVNTLEERAALAEQWLLERLDLTKASADVLQASWELVRAGGNLRIEDLSRSLHVSSRQLQRLFRENMGISPKKLAGLIRYQNLWRDVLYARSFDIRDAVLKYGYTDQAHLLHDFRKYHMLSLTDARNYAYSSHFYNTETENSATIFPEVIP